MKRCVSCLLVAMWVGCGGSSSAGGSGGSAVAPTSRGREQARQDLPALRHPAEGGSARARMPDDYDRLEDVLGAPGLLGDRRPPALREAATRAEATLRNTPPSIRLPAEDGAYRSWAKRIFAWFAGHVRDLKSRAQTARCPGCSASDAQIYEAVIAVEYEHLVRSLLEPPLEGPLPLERRRQWLKTWTQRVASASPAALEQVATFFASCASGDSTGGGEGLNAVRAYCDEQEHFWKTRAKALTKDANSEKGGERADAGVSARDDGGTVPEGTR